MDRTTETLSSFAWELDFRNLGPKVVHQVKRTIIDTLGCALGGFASEPANIARSLASGVSSTTPARVLGTRDYSSPDMAAFANGVMVRYLDCNDSYFSPGGGHPSDMIPAALALAGPQGSDGRTLITSIALAYEVFCRFADQVVASDLGWDQGIFSVIGAACAAGKVLGLDRERMGHAISLAVAPNLPLGVTRTGELSMWKGCAAASATRAGVFAAQLASLGMTGPFEPFEGRRGLWAQAVGKPVEIPQFPNLSKGGVGGGKGGIGASGPESGFRITNTTFKSFPSQIHTQAPIGLALDLRPKVTPQEIKAIKIQSYRAAVSTAATEPEKWDPKTRETADHSIPYLVAAAFQDGAVTPASFTSQRIRDPELRTLIARMVIEEVEEFTRRYPAEYNCRMEVTDKSGQTYAAHTSYPKGHRLNPMDDSEVESKFRRLAGEVLSQRQSNRALEIGWSLEDLQNVEVLFDSLVV